VLSFPIEVFFLFSGNLDKRKPCRPMPTRLSETKQQQEKTRNIIIAQAGIREPPHGNRHKPFNL